MVLFSILLIGVGIGYAGGTYAERFRRAKDGICRHNIWEPWSPAKYRVDGQILDGQKRHCLNCNFEESKVLTA